MPSFVITAFFEVEPGKVPLGRDVVAKVWAGGHHSRHQFSYCDGRVLTVVVEITAPDQAHAFEAVLARVEIVWEHLTGSSLPAPTTVRVQRLVPQEKVAAGAVGRGPDRLFASAAAGRAAALRATVSALSDLQTVTRRRRPHPSPWPEAEGWRDLEDPPDDGGLAGVREPRRPNPPPGGGAVALDLPDLPGA